MDTVNRASALPVSDVATTRTPRILVIDDDRHVRTLLCDLLEAWGYEPDAAIDNTSVPFAPVADVPLPRPRPNPATAAKAEATT